MAFQEFFSHVPSTDPDNSSAFEPGMKVTFKDDINQRFGIGILPDILASILTHGTSLSSLNCNTYYSSDHHNDISLPDVSPLLLIGLSISLTRSIPYAIRFGVTELPYRHHECDKHCLDIHGYSSFFGLVSSCLYHDEADFATSSEEF